MADMELLTKVLQYLQIENADENTRQNILGFISRGKNRLNKIAGAELNYEEEGQPSALLLDYCRYANSRALEVFEKNFRSELLDLNLESQVNGYEAENAD